MTSIPLWGDETLLNMDAKTKDFIGRSILGDRYINKELSLREISIIFDEILHNNSSNEDRRNSTLRSIYFINKRAEGLTLQTISDLSGVSGTRVRESYERIIKKLKEPRKLRRISKFENDFIASTLYEEEKEYSWSNSTLHDGKRLDDYLDGYFSRTRYSYNEFRADSFRKHVGFLQKNSKDKNGIERAIYIINRRSEGRPDDRIARECGMTLEELQYIFSYLIRKTILRGRDSILL